MNFLDTVVNLTISLFAITPVVYVIVGIYYWRLKPAKSISYFSLLMFAFALYSFGYFLEINSKSPDSAFFLRNFEYLGTSFVPPFFILFIVQTTKAFHIKAKLTAALFSVSFAIWLLYATNPVTGLFYKSIRFSVGRYGGEILTVKNIGYYLLLLYFTVILVISSVILFKAVQTAKTKNSRNRFRFLFYTFQISWLTVIFILSGFDKYVDPTPLTIMIICGMFSGNAVYNDMFERNLIRWDKNYAGIQNPAILVDADGAVVSSNTAAKEFIGELNKTFEDIIPALDDGEKNRNPVLFRVDDKPKWVDVKKSIINTKGTLINYLLVDVSDEKHASLMAELFFDAISDFIFISTRTGALLFVNREVKSKLGYIDEEIKKMRIADFHPADMRKEAEIFYDRVFASLDKNYNLPLQAKDGLTIPVETRIWIDNWNGEPVIFCMSKDISLFKEAENKFEKSFYKNPAIMAISDVNTGAYLDVNDAFICKLGYGKEELIGQSASVMDIFVNKDQRTQAKMLLLRDGEFSNIEADIKAKNGEIFKGLFSGGFITTGNTTTLLTIMIDITENYKKDNLLKMLTSVTQDFLRAENFMEPIPNAFALFGKTFDVSSVFLFKTELDKAGFISAVQSVAEWCFPDRLNPGDSDWQKFGGHISTEFFSPLTKGQTLAFSVRDMEEGFFKASFSQRGIKTVLAVPVFINETFWGFFGVHECRNERQWTPLDESILSVFADSLVMAIQRHQSSEQIEFLSFHDHLTGLYNRRFYEAEILRIDNSDYYPITLVMADVNGLKLINDAFGHDAGDLLLRKISSILTKECRAQDITARIGGDEFVVLLPNTDANQAKAIIKRLNSAVSKEHFDHLMLSVSIGFAVKRNSLDSMNDIFKQAEDDMYRNKLSESSSIRSKTIDLILNSFYEKNNREMLHSHRVGNFCESIAKAMDFSKDDISQMNIAGMMHDIGKIGISEETLNKPGGLHDNEWAELKRHSEIGYRILGSVSEFSRIADYVLEHHERVDGKGYPKGLTGDKISVQAKIISLADAYDAMTSDRSYRKKMSVQEAVCELKRCCGTQFDPDIAKIFVENVLCETW